MTSLNDLSDVNAPTPSDLDRLVYDAGTSMWVPGPQINWERSQGTITYPAGDNGHVHIDTTAFGPVPLDNTAVIAEPPSGSLAFQFTVTSAMVAVDASFAALPCPAALNLSLSGTPADLTGTRTLRTQCQVNDTYRSDASASISTSRLVAGVALTTKSVVAGDVVKVFAWLAGSGSEKFTADQVIATPYTDLLVPGSGDDDKLLLTVAATATQGADFLGTAPDGMSVTVMGSTSLTSSQRQTYQSGGVAAGDNATIQTSSNGLGIWALRAPAGKGSYVWENQTISAVSSSDVPPYLFRTMRYTTIDLWSTLLPADGPWAP